MGTDGSCLRACEDRHLPINMRIAPLGGREDSGPLEVRGDEVEVEEFVLLMLAIFKLEPAKRIIAKEAGQLLSVAWTAWIGSVA
jgi:hypothetical protein